MLILFVAVAAVLLLTHGISTPQPGSPPSLWLGVATLVGLPLAGGLLGFLHAPRKESREGLASTHPLRLARARRLTLIPVLLLFGLAVLGGDWIGLVKSWISPRVPVLTHLVGLAPVLLASLFGLIALHWISRSKPRFPAGLESGRTPQSSSGERANGLPWKTTSPLSLDLRLLFLPLVPFLFFMSILDLGWYLPRLQEVLATNALAATAGIVILLLVILLLSPLVVRHLWPSQPLPPGPLRTRLETLAREARLGFSDIRVWRTGPRGVMNACITGLIPRFRYIFFTDTLLEELEPEEIEGVFAHELGHAHHRHFALYFAVVIAFFLVYSALAPHLPRHPALELLIIGAFGYVYFGHWFGILSRHFELQADRFGASLLATPGYLSNALKRIAVATRSLHRKRGWRHPTIPERVELLWRLHEDDEARGAFERKTRRFQGAILTCLLVGAIACGLEVLRTSQQPEFNQSREVAAFLMQEYREGTLRPGRAPLREQALLRRACGFLAQAEESMRSYPELEHERRETLLELAQIHDLLGNKTEAFLTRQRAQMTES